jgi:hypothetical protein
MSHISTTELKRVQFRISEKSHQNRRVNLSESQVRRLVRWLFMIEEPRTRMTDTQPIMSIGDD